MQFLAPSLLLGMLAAVIPLLVHLIGKRRAVPVRFAAMQLLLRAERRVSARRRLRELLLLLARTAIAASLPFIFARPFAERSADVHAASFESQSAVILLDDSASMRRLRSGGTFFDLAKDRARQLVRQFPSDSDLALVLASAASRPPLGELEPERSRVVQALEGVSASARTADFGAALRRAVLILSASPRNKTRIFVITDLQANGWAEAGVPALPASTEVVVVDVAGDRPWENRAVVDVRAEPAPEAGVAGLAITAEIADYSPQGVAALGVSLKLDGAPVARGFLDLAPGGRAKKTFLHALPAGGGGVHDLEVEIDRDTYRLDDRRMAHVELARTVRALIVNGDARTARTEDETFFLETALKVGASGAQITVALPDDVPAESLASYTVVMLANVAAPSGALAAALTRFVENGGGLFLSVGARVDAAAWNHRLASLLPQPIGLPRTVAALPGQHAGETLDDRPAERLAPIDRRHPLLAAFAARGEGLATARFFKYLLLEPVPDSAERSVILRYESGAPALVERRVGEGRVILLSTTVDREWTDLPIRPGFLPLVQESARRLVRASEREGTTALLVGQTRELALAPDDRRLEVVKPDGSVWVAQQEKQRPGRTLVFHDTGEPGTYAVRVTGADGVTLPRPSDGFVVNVDLRESNPARLAPERRPDRLHQAAAGATSPKHRVELWHGLAAALIGIVLIESLLTVRWRRSVLLDDLQRRRRAMT